MKGLLLKDFMLFKNQITSIIIVIATAFFMLVMGNDAVFIVGYTTMIFAIFSISTINYDHFDNGYAFLFTLPITRKLYVLEKYVFSLLTLILGNILSYILFFAASFVNSQYALTSSTVIFITGYTMGTIIFLTLVLPIQLKFGPEKGRIAMMILALIIFASLSAISTVLEKISLPEIPLDIFESTPIYLLGILAIVDGIFLTISYQISCNIIQKKEF